MRLHLIDGTYELFRSYFGAPPRSSPGGIEVGAVNGIVASTLSLLESDGVTHVAAAFDTVIDSFRNDLYPGYKTGEGVPEELLAQFPLAEEALEAIGVTVWRMTEYEADDAIASAVARYAGDFDQVVIMSPDKDLAQCVRGNSVVTFDRRKGAFIDEAGVIEKFGVRPSSIPDYLGLVGDSADGFPGVRGWGAKSAGAVLAHYHHIERIPLEASLWEPEVRGAQRLVESLRAGIADALLFRFLAMLRLDVPLTETTDDLWWRGVPREAFAAMTTRFGFDTLRDRPKTWEE
jgi:5'-3' exonuclease